MITMMAAAIVMNMVMVRICRDDCERGEVIGMNLMMLVNLVLEFVPAACMDLILSPKRDYTQVIRTKVPYRRSSKINLLPHPCVQSANQLKSVLYHCSDGHSPSC